MERGDKRKHNPHQTPRTGQLPLPPPGPFSPESPSSNPQVPSPWRSAQRLTPNLRCVQQGPGAPRLGWGRRCWHSGDGCCPPAVCTAGPVLLPHPQRCCVWTLCRQSSPGTGGSSLFPRTGSPGARTNRWPLAQCLARALAAATPAGHGVPGLGQADAPGGWCSPDLGRLY